MRCQRLPRDVRTASNLARRLTLGYSYPLPCVADDFLDTRLTERRNPRSATIDTASALEIVDLIGAEDAGVPGGGRRAREEIARAIDLIEAAFRAGGRLIYVGPAPAAGSACSMPPSARRPSARHPRWWWASSPAARPALVRSIEGAEDDVNAASARWTRRRSGPTTSSSGSRRVAPRRSSGRRSPGRRRSGRAPRWSPAPSRLALLTETCDVCITVLVGPEIVTGSTRMKAGTATKLVLNTLTTGAMIRLGKIYGNLMVDLRAWNDKLIDRSQRIVMETTGLDRERGPRRASTRQTGSVKTAIVMARRGVSKDEAERLLAEHAGRLRPSWAIRRRCARDDRAPHARRRPHVRHLARRHGCRAGRLEGPPTPRSSTSSPGPTDEERRRDPRGAQRTARTSRADSARLHVQVAEWAADAVQTLWSRGAVPASELSLIAFPGQTIWHEPPLVSWQLGEPAVLAERFGVRVVSGFRARDVAAGGQGAPLVPMADVLLFAAADAPRVLLNLGGMANLTYVPRRAQEDGVLAFDTGPGVAVIDAVARLVDPRRSYDRDGQIAAQGTADEAALAELLADHSSPRRPPRAPGASGSATSTPGALHERVPGRRRRGHRGRAHRPHRRRCGRPLDPGRRRRSSPRAAGATIPDSWRLWHGASTAPGAHPLRRFDELFFPGDAKEAVAFALLGYLTLHGQPGNVPAATGAGGPRVLGHGDPSMTAADRRSNPARLILPALRSRPTSGFGHEAGADRRRARSRRGRLHHLRRHRRERCAG